MLANDSSSWQNEMVTLAQKDSALWRISAVVLVLMIGGILALSFPTLLQHRSDLLGDPKAMPQLITALMCLMALFGVYVNTQRRELSRSRDALYRQYLLEQQKSKRLLDSETQTYSPVMLQSLVERMSGEASPEAPLSILNVQLCELGSIRRKNGEAAVEHLIRSLAEILRSCTRGSDRICRGREGSFVVFLPDTPESRAVVPADRIFAAVTKWNRSTALLDYRMAVEVQVTCADSKPQEPQELLTKVGLAASERTITVHGMPA